MFSKYPVIKKNIILHQGILHNMIKEIGNEKRTCSIGKDARNIMKECNGKLTVEKIFKKYPEKDREDILNFMKENIYITFSNEKTKSNMIVTGLEDVQIPGELNIELTDNCNYRCNHCYNSSDDSKKNYINKDELFDLLRKLRENGTTALELTGGEIFAHPESQDILKFAFENFDQILLLTNLSLISKKEIELISQHNDKVKVQVSVNNSKKTHKEFINSNYDLEKVLDNIKEITNCGGIVEATTVVHDKNKDEIEDIIKLTRSAGCLNISFSPIMMMGNALKNDFKQVPIEELKNTLEPYQDYLKKMNVYKNAVNGKRVKNCGIGYDTVCISPLGDVKACVIDLNNHVNPGNLLKEDPLVVLKRLNDKKIHNIISPRESECGDCQELDFCKYCIIKGLNKYEEIGEKCKWGSNYASYI